MERFLSYGHDFTIVEFLRGKTPKVYGQELRFLCSARRLIMLYISMKFNENILNGFKVIGGHDCVTDGQTDG